MGARDDLENLIGKEMESGNYNGSLNDLAKDIADKLHYAFETSRGLNGKDGTFLFSCKETIELLQNIGYIDKQLPIEQFGTRYYGELNSSARDIYERLNKEGNFPNSNLAKIPLFNYPNPEPKPLDYAEVFEPQEDDSTAEGVLEL